MRFASGRFNLAIIFVTLCNKLDKARCQRRLRASATPLNQPRSVTQHFIALSLYAF